MTDRNQNAILQERISVVIMETISKIVAVIATFLKIAWMILKLLCNPVTGLVELLQLLPSSLVGLAGLANRAASQDMLSSARKLLKDLRQTKCPAEPVLTAAEEELAKLERRLENTWWNEKDDQQKEHKRLLSSYLSEVRTLLAARWAEACRAEPDQQLEQAHEVPASGTVAA